MSTASQQQYWVAVSLRQIEHGGITVDLGDGVVGILIVFDNEEQARKEVGPRGQVLPLSVLPQGAHYE